MTRAPEPAKRRSLPPQFPPPQFPPVKLAAFQRMPPAVFPPIMGLFGLGLALRKALEAAGQSTGLAEAVLGSVTLLWLFALLGYGVKVARRPGVLREDLRILPGRAGLAAMVLSALLLAAVALPYAPGLAEGLMWAGLLAHGALALLIAQILLAGPPEARDVTPVWHLSFVGFIIAGLSAAPLGYAGLGAAVFWGTMPVAFAIWVVSLRQLFTRIPPAPLRPLLAIHLAPASLFGTVALVNDAPQLAQGFAVLGALILLALLASVRWLTVAGFSALWGAFTFPLAAYGGLLLGLGGVWLWPGMAVLLAALAIVPPIAVKVMQAWAKGTLAAKTNAATA